MQALPEATSAEPASTPAPAAEIAKAESKTAAVVPTQTTIRVEFDRVDRLINLVGELVINQAMLSQRVIEANFAGSSSVVIGLDELEQLTREIQDSVMAIRAQPVKPVFQRMSRMVREVADVTGKSVRLETEGEATEVDKTVIERLADPLTHMIRNADRSRHRNRRKSASPPASPPKASSGLPRRTAPAASSSKSRTTAPASIAPKVRAVGDQEGSDRRRRAAVRRARSTI